MTRDRLQDQRAIEALRSGVPNRNAVLALGCPQPAIEARFRSQLERLKAGERPAGLLVEGGFGAGKSHLLEYLEQLALSENFVVSRLVISKETPLYDPIRMYRAAMQAGTVPGARGALMAEIAARLDLASPAYRALVSWLHAPGTLNPRFAATLLIHERLGHDPEVADRLVRFWAGEQMPLHDLKRYLRACGETVSYAIDKIPLPQLALQRFAFAPRLIAAAGYAGWVVLVDEVELIGRYSLLQRARAYAELARWLSPREGAPLAAVLAITDDFQSAVLEEKEDLVKLPAKLRARATDVDLALVGPCLDGMRAIQGERVPLPSPSPEVLAMAYERVRELHAGAYDWDPPPVASVEALSTTRMREYVKGWITAWDLLRLDPAYRVEIEAMPLAMRYDEEPNLLVPIEGESATVEG